MGECYEKAKDHFALRGHVYLIIITILEILYFLAYTLIFVLTNKNDPNSSYSAIVKDA